MGVFDKSQSGDSYMNPIPYLNPNERKVNQQIKLDICANRFYDHMEKRKDVVLEYLDKRFGTQIFNILQCTTLF